MDLFELFLVLSHLLINELVLKQVHSVRRMYHFLILPLILHHQFPNFLIPIQHRLFISNLKHPRMLYHVNCFLVIFEPPTTTILYTTILYPQPSLFCILFSTLIKVLIMGVEQGFIPYRSGYHRLVDRHFVWVLDVRRKRKVMLLVLLNVILPLLDTLFIDITVSR